jgi:minor extracellular serine protease Vpr
MSTSLKRLWGLVLVVVLACSLVLPAGAAPGGPRDAADQTVSRPGVDRAMALVQLAGDPLATAARTRPAPGKKIDFNSDTVKSYRAQLAALRNDFKAWLRANAPKARVTGEFDISLNAVSVQLNGERLETIAASSMVALAEYQGLYRPLDDNDPDLAIIEAVQAWTAGGGAANAGAGVKVAIVDTGIDATHPCFDDTGYPAQTQLGDQRFTNNKVIAAKVFYNKAGVSGLTPKAIQSHGTHVAGTVACNLDTPATVSGVDIPYGISGVAPRALLGNYNVFPGEVGDARSEDILNALDAAYADGFDVANMSLGGGASGVQDLLAKAVDNLDEANMVVAVAAGNSGPGHYTVESPGSAARALTAGASTVPHFVGAPVTVGGTAHGAASGDFPTVKDDLTAPLGVVTGTTNGLSTACSALPAGSLSGKVALISRGTCTFSVKIRNAQSAGAVAVLVANNVAGDPTAMASDGAPNQPTVPAYMVGLTVGQALLKSNGAPTTLGAELQYFLTENVDIMAGFSSQGPTDVDFRVKPDVVAPGVNVLSAVPASACEKAPCFAFFQGTSMATPHLAGSAAVVRQQHPTWTAAQVRSAIVNTAERGVLTAYTDGKTVVTDVNIEGAGRENLADAVGATVALDPVSVSFGAVPSGSGQTKTFDVTLTNVAGAAATYAVAISGYSGKGGVTFSVSQSSVTLAPGASATVTITITASKSATKGDHQAWLTISKGGSEVAHAAVYTLMK